jgi:O-antigen/teichoic acid export membrane protein
MKIKELVTNRVILNSLISILGKVLVSGSSLLSVSVLLHLLGNKQYGEWVTLTSIVLWLQLMDLGIGNGLRNKITTHLAVGDISSASRVYAGALQLYLLISIGLAVLCPVFIQAISIPGELFWFAILLYVPFILQLPLSLGASVLAGARKMGLVTTINALQPILFLISLIALAMSEGTITIQWLILIWLFCYLTGNMILFFVSAKEVRLRFNDVVLRWGNLKHAKPIINASVQFFILQITSIIFFNLGNYLVYMNLGPEEAAKYDTINKLYLFFITIFNMVISVVWSELTHHMQTRKFKKAKRVFKNLFIITILFTSIPVSFSFIVPFVIKVWTNGQIEVVFREVLPFSMVVALQAIAYSGAVVLNAAERILGQIIISIITSVILIPLSLHFFSSGLGVISVPLSIGICLVPTAILCNYWAIKLLIAGEKHVQKTAEEGIS